MHGPRRYVFVWIALIALTGTTYGMSRVDLGGHWNLVVAMTIAVAKASLVVMFFMHLWDAKGMNRLVLIVSLFFVFLLIAGVVGDMATRFPLARPPEATGLVPPGQAAPERGVTHGGANERPR